MELYKQCKHCFQAIFADDASPADDARGGGAGGANLGDRPEQADGGAVYSWAQHRMCALLFFRS